MMEMENKLASPFSLLKQAWSLALARPNILSYLILGTLPQLLSFLIAALVAYITGSTNLQTAITGIFTNNNAFAIAGMIAVGVIGVLLVIFLSTWYTALLYKVYQETAAGTIHKLTTYVRPAKEITGRLLVTYLTVGLFTSLGFLLLIIPGIIIAVRYMFAPMIATIEDRSVKPIDESKRLVKGRFWKLVGRSIVVIVAYNIPASILQAIHPALGMMWSVTSPIFGLYYFLVYQDFKRTAVAAI